MPAAVSLLATHVLANAGALPRHVASIRFDKFVLPLAGTVFLATFLPCRGASASILHAAGMVAISTLFFLQGARLSRDAITRGIMHWRLHSLIAATTFALFPLFGVLLWWAEPLLLPRALWLGVIFACALPSTVQSSIALTSIANGNVAGAVCAATLSNIAGIMLTPVLFGALSAIHGHGAFHLSVIGMIALQLLAPFVAGHMMRPWIGAWAERNRGVLSVTDRGSILLVNYTSFSAAVINGVWLQVSRPTLLMLVAITGLLLALALAATHLLARALRLSHDDEITALLCGSQKSLVSGVPIANVLFGPASAGPALLPIMVYYPLQLVVGSMLAKSLARRQAPAYGQA